MTALAQAEGLPGQIPVREPDWRLDMAAYCRRIGVARPLAPTVDVLRMLHRRQATTIVYENVDLHLGRPIRVDLPSVEGKLVHDARGGYCFELNGLFAAVLEELGYPVVRVGARVRRGSPGVVRARTHVAMVVTAGDRRWLADVGFGGATPLEPVELVPERPSTQGVWSYRLTLEPGGTWVLQTWQDHSWTDLYCFTEEPQFQADIEMANHFTSTHPSSRFVHTLTAQLPGPRAQLNLRGRQFEVLRPGGREVHDLPDDRSVVALLARRFRLRLPPDSRFVAPTNAAAAESTDDRAMQMTERCR